MEMLSSLQLLPRSLSTFYISIQLFSLTLKGYYLKHFRAEGRDWKCWMGPSWALYINSYGNHLLILCLHYKLYFPKKKKKKKKKPCSYKETVLNIHWKDWCWSWNSNTLAIWCKELIHWKRPWCWERLKAGGEGDKREWDDWMASLTQWTWDWVGFGSWWWTGMPGMLQSMGLQRVGHNWADKETQSPCTASTM